VRAVGADARRAASPPAAARRSDREAPAAGGRRKILVVGGALLVVAAIVIVLVSSSGSSSKNPTSSSAQTLTPVTTATGKPHTKTKSAASTTAPAANPAETVITVLNGTEKPGLAHRISSQLQQSGYSQANALGGRPAGANQTTVVEYAAGHQADAEGVARSLSIKQVQPIEASVVSLAGPAKVVVIVGADTAAKLP
jgi:hypothetical protein